MKNSIKLMEALKQAFPGHNVEFSYNFNAKLYCVFIDDNYAGNFEERFYEQDSDNPEIEIKVKAPLYNIKDFLDEVECDGVFYRAVERGLQEWQEESQANN